MKTRFCLRSLPRWVLERSRAFATPVNAADPTDPSGLVANWIWLAQDDYHPYNQTIIAQDV